MLAGVVSPNMKNVERQWIVWLWARASGSFVCFLGVHRWWLRNISHQTPASLQPAIQFNPTASLRCQIELTLVGGRESSGTTCNRKPGRSETSFSWRAVCLRRPAAAFSPLSRQTHTGWVFFFVQTKSLTKLVVQADWKANANIKSYSFLLEAGLVSFQISSLSRHRPLQALSYRLSLNFYLITF